MSGVILYTRPVTKNITKGRRLARFGNPVLVIVLLGVVHWIYVTSDNGWRIPRYHVLTAKVVKFEWSRGNGFTRFDVEAYPGRWIGARLLRGLLAAQLKPRVAKYLEPSKLQKTNGETVFSIASFCPFVLSDSLGTDASEVHGQ
jgi:hypothetical protein